MSIPVDLDDLAATLAGFGTAYLLTSRDGRVKAVHAVVEVAGDELLVRRPGGGSLRNVGTVPATTLVWPPRADPGFSLIVDGTGAADGDDVRVSPTGAVLHRPVAEDDERAARPFWVTAFVDVAEEHWDRVPAFWAAVAGQRLGPSRGEAGEFASLEPLRGHPHLKVQRVPSTSRVHLDLHVPDPHRAAARAEQLGARVEHRSEHGFVVMRSPGGLTFCFVAHPACLRAPAATWPDGSVSAVDQVCIDAPARLHAAEAGFWAALTGWAPQASSVGSAFSSLRRPEGQAVRLLLQQVEDDRSEVSAHLDVACSDRRAEAARHEALGAVLVAEHDRWTVLRAPDGAAYCLTDRDPVSGVL
ncbi:VOC family protein [Nocardioides zeae]|uniref:VOC family protein n=1 Tax=Nocardioides imazamoxiresistens TaxID=3231893 RepID=A0ABU3PTP4_9ACTN|nr:VOC family protein [Nocardioides zeae]MDT9592595.1 VOC family protein [Nocardioides zeae]